MTKDNGASCHKVGYKKPPVKNQFRKGQSGNPAGRPKKAFPEAVNVMDVLSEPVKTTLGNKACKMSAYEASIRKMVQGALKDSNLEAALKFVTLCAGTGLLKKPETPPACNVITVPKEYDFQQWVAENVITIDDDTGLEITSREGE